MNNQASIIASSSINEPFVSRVSPEAASIRRFVRDVSNDTARPGDAFQWADGSASVHHIRSSRVHVVQLCCHVIILYDTLHRARSNPRFTYIRALPPFKSVLVRMLPSDGPLHCAGSGRIFSEHGAGSQRLWISGSSTRGKASGIGEVTDDQLSEGNRIVDLSDELREKMDRIYDGDVIGPSGAVLNILTEVEEEFTRGLDEYNNVAFLILSVAAILSSAAIATVSPVREWEGLAVVLVEAIVVYSFLGIVSHATVVFNRADTFAVDIRHRSHGNFTYNGRIVQVFRESVIMTVGEPLKKAVMLLITEGFAVAAAVMVSVTLAASVRQVRLSKKRRDASADGMDEKEA